MRFTLVDQIIDIQSGKSITAVKSPSLTEDFLKDHFPLFPVMPGVLMIESMYQASAWLVRTMDDFSHSMVLLREAKNVKYAGLVRPGQQLVIKSTLQKREDDQSWFKAEGTIDGKVAVSGRLILHQYNLADDDPARSYLDQNIIAGLRHELKMLCHSDISELILFFRDTFLTQLMFSTEVGQYAANKRRGV